ncbi:MAG: ATP-binding protein, partial [Chloroflexota bacterium]
PFSQIEESYSRKYEGTGLGLVLTKNFTEMLGGSITLQSDVDVGTEFRVVIPVVITTELRFRSEGELPI